MLYMNDRQLAKDVSDTARSFLLTDDQLEVVLMALDDFASSRTRRPSECLFCLATGEECDYHALDETMRDLCQDVRSALDRQRHAHYCNEA